MLFNSWAFILGFLPVAVLLYQAAPLRAAVQLLVLCSLFYYGWWNPSYLLLIVGSTLGNYLVGQRIAAATLRRGAWLAAGVTANLLLLGYFKYLDFLIGSINYAFGAGLPLQHVALPLAISFFTFQQIAYLVDVHRGQLSVRDLSRFGLFVTFFPQLIAGPIVHYREMIPQFGDPAARRDRLHHVAVGIGIFTLGLFKKTVIADGLGQYADAIFAFTDAGGRPTFAEAWAGALAYSFQLYFDFSGYADMAIGSARMFGIVLPANFNSPYKSLSIVDFWRRWHMTLSRFLRDYLYIPLGGNRGGVVSRHTNLMLTMLLGGLWHGAGWTFVVWGGLHGSYLVINHLWRHLRRHVAVTPPSALAVLASWSLTFLCVCVAWVLFRSETFSGATAILAVMAGADGIALPSFVLAWLGDAAQWLRDIGLVTIGPSSHGLVRDWYELLVLIAVGLVVCVAAPNSQQMFAHFKPVLESTVPARRLAVRLNACWGAVFGVAAVVACLYMTTRGQVEFIYRFF